MAELPDKDEILYVDLKGRDPDEGFTQVPYVKGMLFLRRLEEIFGRDTFDTFLRGYFNQFAFKSIVTGDFVDYLQQQSARSESRSREAKSTSTSGSRSPACRKTRRSPNRMLSPRQKTAAKEWCRRQTDTDALPVKSWTTPEWLHFLRSLPPNLDAKRMADLDRAFNLTQSGNSEILADWLLMAIRSGYQPAYPKLDRFLVEVGRRKYIKPLYQELAKTPKGKEHAKAVYAKARPGYHPIAVTTIDDLLK